ncbi:KGGVGR-motif variant AAA ATPase [Streptomyces naphthomycinicus]|uniref:KGGVGR-motif variant AAA ATPase n=1 Tax=Streptomyces naphthomycinicus TaxID=2872625 RepID=UPI001CECBA80|nr:NACHT domain-containing protein [Streptomyces sp. TML10]
MSRIITFYSYKGGTGRSMALANTAWILASNGRRVLMVDWDLEAPGLHRYFHPFLPDHELRSSPGVIDMVWEYATAATDPTAADEPGWPERLAAVRPYAMSVEYEFPGKGTIDFVPAGRQDPLYSTLVTTFDWNNFYERLGGGGFVEALKRNMRAHYDYVLIDSRTGLSDTAGICTVQFPDILVNCFSHSNQAIDGAEAVASSVHRQRARNQLRMFPVPMRVEDGEADRLEAGRHYAEAAFGRYLSHVRDPKAYWGRVEVPYKPFYAYEEVLATFRDEPGHPGSVLAATERLVGYLTDGDITGLGAPLAQAERQAILRRFQRPRPQDPDLDERRVDKRPARVLICYAYDSAEHFEAVRELWWLLRGSGVDAQLDHTPGLQDETWLGRQRSELLEADVILIIASSTYREQPAEGTAQLLELFAARPARFLAVVLPGGSLSALPGSLDRDKTLRRWRLIDLTPDRVDALIEQINRRAPMMRASDHRPLDETLTWNLRHTDPGLARMADRLGRMLYLGYQEQRLVRMLADPNPLALRWQLSILSMAGAGDVDMPIVSGELVTGADELLAALPYGRMVLLGPSGSGKTSAVLLLALRLLRLRAEGQPVPVPLVLPLSSWSPREEPLSTWITGQLQRRYGLSHAIAERLVREGLVMPVLDGLDELAPTDREYGAHVLQRGISPDSPYIVTCRTAEYQSLIQNTGLALNRTTVLELQPLLPRDVTSYLSRTQLLGDQRWRPVCESLDTDPSGPLARALSRPVMVQLAAEIYRSPSTDPTELLAFADTAAIQEHLLTALVPTAYHSGAANGMTTTGRSQGPFTPAVTRWLAFLAAHLQQEGTHEYHWWSLHHAIGRMRLRLWLALSGTVLTIPFWALIGRQPAVLLDQVPNAFLPLAGLGAFLTATIPFTVVREPLPRRISVARRRGEPGLLSPLTRVIDLTRTASPRATLRQDRRATLLTPLATGMLAGTAATALLWSPGRPGLSAVTGLVAFTVTFLMTLALVVGRSASARYTIAVSLLAFRGRIPWRLTPFLADAHARGVLRMTGAAYEFRHRQLETLLASMRGEQREAS